MRICGRRSLVYENGALSFLFGVLDHQAELVEVWQLYLGLVCSLDQLDCLVGCDDSFLYHFCLLLLESLDVLIAYLNNPILNDEYSLILPCFRGYSFPALKDDFLVFAHLRVPILGTLLLYYLIGDQSI